MAADNTAKKASTHAFGLLGRTLGHSWSPQIHNRLGSAPYDLIELEPDEVEPFIREGEWRGLNVTIPYKRQAFLTADDASDRARRLGVANTLVRRKDGSIFADNTDLSGFAWLLERFCRRELGQGACEALTGHPVLVLGSGGASQAVQAALADAGAHVSVISRTGADTYATLLERHQDAELVVNATPVGMYPNCPASPLTDAQMDGLSHLHGVLDVVYNPVRTGICLQAEERSIPSQSGLAMLVAQAYFSSEQFQGRSLDEDLVASIERSLLADQENVVLIGMPGAGKTTTGRALARLLGRPFIDLDEAFRVSEGVAADPFIRAKGIDAFREKESGLAADFGKRSGLVIACGGGIVTRPENYASLHQNGRIVLIERPLEELSTKGRPVSQAEGVKRLAEERGPLYHAWADVTLHCTGTARGDALEARRLLGL